MTDFCRHPGCLQALSPGNVSGVCRAHVHGAACRCTSCRAPRKARGGKRPHARWRVKQRPELEAEGLLLPGLSLMKLTLPKGPTSKGSP